MSGNLGSIAAYDRKVAEREQSIDDVHVKTTSLQRLLRRQALKIDPTRDPEAESQEDINETLERADAAAKKAVADHSNLKREVDEIKQGANNAKKVLQPAASKLMEALKPLSAEELQNKVSAVDPALITQLLRIIAQAGGGHLDFLRNTSPENRRLLLDEEDRTSLLRAGTAPQVELLQQQVEYLKTQVSDLEERTKKADKLQIDIEDSRDALQQTRASHEKSLQVKAVELTAIREEQLQAQQKIGKLNEQLEQKADKYEVKLKMANDLAAQRLEEADKLEQQLQASRATGDNLVTVQQDLAAREIEVNKLQEDNEDLHRKLGTYAKTVPELENEKQALSTRVEDLEHKIKLQDDRVQSLETLRASRDRKIAELKSKVEEVEAKEQETFESYRLVKSDFEDEKALRERAEEIKKKAQSERNTRDERIIQLSADLEAMRVQGSNRVAELETRVSGANAVIERLRGEHDTAESATSQVRHLLDDLCTRVTSFPSEHAQRVEFLTALSGAPDLDPVTEVVHTSWIILGEVEQRIVGQEAYTLDIMAMILTAMVQAGQVDTAFCLHRLAQLTASLRRNPPVKVNIFGIVLGQVCEATRTAPTASSVAVMSWWQVACLLDRGWPSEQVIQGAKQYLKTLLSGRDPVLGLVLNAIENGTLAEFRHGSVCEFPDLNLSLVKVQSWDGLLVISPGNLAIFAVARSQITLESLESLRLKASEGEDVVISLTEAQAMWYVR